MFVFNQRSLRAFNEKTLVHYKKHATIMAVLMLICGICCLIYPIAAGVYLSYATGFMFLVCGFYSIYSLFSSSKKQLKAKFTYAFFAIACCLFILGGIFRIASGVKLFHSPGYGWNIFIGIFDLLIAGVWLNMDPDRSYVFTSIFIGVEMIFSSLAFISLRRNATLVKTDKLADKN
ncbi:acid-resistance protein [Citrobacter freundii]|nr:acid-resistance protein [Citrobacter freundii]